MIFTNDSDIEKIRSTISGFLPSGVTSWKEYHKYAGEIVTRDIEYKWFPKAVKERYFSDDFTDYDFDASLLLCGFNHFSTDTTDVNSGERVYIESSHDSGGDINSVYESVADLTSTDLSDVNFSASSLWTDITDSLLDDLKDLAAYKTLFLIYRFIANDQPDTGSFEKQRDYFENEYNKEFSVLLERGVPYDWDESGTIEDDEKSRVNSGLTRITVW